MTATTAPKHPVLAREEIPDAECLLIQELSSSDPAAYAAANLGYAHPAHTKAKEAQTSLAREIRKTGVKPFTGESVARYKTKKARIPCLGRFIEALGLPFAITLVGAIGAVLLNLGVVAYGKLTGTEWLANAAWMTQPSIVTLACCSFFLVLFWFLAYQNKWVTVREGSWSRTDINGYTSEIPNFALLTMQEIHMRCPDAKFWVEEMHERNRLMDPFLGVTDPESGRDYYLEVWNEPDFKAERVA